MVDSRFLPYVLIMAGVTYLLRMLPLTIFQKKINSRFVKSFLFYVPFGVLGAMTFPAILFSTTSVRSALVGLGVAILLAWKEKDLLTVALCACGSVFLTEAGMFAMELFRLPPDGFSALFDNFQTASGIFVRVFM